MCSNNTQNIEKFLIEAFDSKGLKMFAHRYCNIYEYVDWSGSLADQVFEFVKTLKSRGGIDREFFTNLLSERGGLSMKITELCREILGANPTTMLPLRNSTINNDKIVAGYILGAKIATSNQGEVYHIYPEGCPSIELALKILKPNRKYIEKVEKIMPKYAKLQQCGLLGIRDVLCLDGNKLAIVMDYISGISLNQWMSQTQGHPCRSRPQINRANMEIALSIALQVRSAHGHDFIHGNIKPSNLRIIPSPQGPTVRVTGFYLAPIMGHRWEAYFDNTIEQKCWTLAPERQHEILTGKNAGEKISFASDVYSVAALFLQLILGEEPPVYEDASSAIEYVDWDKINASIPGVSKVKPFMSTCPTSRSSCISELICAFWSSS